MMKQLDMVADFEMFLSGRGLKLVAREEPEQAMGYRLIEYAGDGIRVRLVHEKGFWDLLLADDRAKPDVWYALSTFTYLLAGSPQPQMVFERQLDYARSHWAQIAQAFSPSQWNETHVRLDAAKKERARALFEIWPALVLDLESYLTKMGLVCIYRERPQFVGDTMAVQYSGLGVAVRMSSQTRWDVEFADLHYEPGRWYRFDVIRRLVQWPDNEVVPWRKKFAFVKENFARIISAFSEGMRDNTCARLREIEQSISTEGL